MTSVRIPTCLDCKHCEKKMLNTVFNTTHMKITCIFPSDRINPPPRIDMVPSECPDTEARQARLKFLENISMRSISLHRKPKPQLTIGEESHIQNACPKTMLRGITDSSTDLPTPPSREPNQKGLEGELARFCEVFKPIPEPPTFKEPTEPQWQTSVEGWQ